MAASSQRTYQPLSKYTHYVNHTPANWPFTNASRKETSWKFAATMYRNSSRTTMHC